MTYATKTVRWIFWFLHGTILWIRWNALKRRESAIGEKLLLIAIKMLSLRAGKEMEYFDATYIKLRNELEIVYRKQEKFPRLPEFIPLSDFK